MNWLRDCAAVVPCFNEAAAIGPVVTGIRQHLTTVVVVDDGSTDSTGQAAQKAGAQVIRLEVNSGKGAALAVGWEWARANGFTWVICMDGDGQHLAADMPPFLRCAEQRDAALIIGNRMADSTGMPLIRRWTNRWLSRRLSRLAGQDLPDTQCGFRLMRLATEVKLRLETKHFEVESETLLNFLAAGLRVEFVPIQTVYKDEQSKIHPVKDAWRWWRWWRRARRNFRNASRAS
jgi:glycosyltransferase involved in cell wall biosynthesis